MTFEKPTLCNCDARGFNLTDEGIIWSDQLPIYGLQFGGSFTPYSNVKFDIGPLMCSGKKGHYPSEAKILEKEKLNIRLNELTNYMEETKADLNELSDHAAEADKQNLKSKTTFKALKNDYEETKMTLHNFTNRNEVEKQTSNLKVNQLASEIKELKENFDGLADQADEVKKQNLNSRLNQLENELDETKAGLSELTNQAKEIEGQNLNSRIIDLKNEMNETKIELNELANQAREVEKQNLNSKIHNLTIEISETKNDLRGLSEQLEDHIRNTTAINTTSLYQFEKIGPFKASKSKKIGEITKYYENFEFSMELKYKSLEVEEEKYRQILREMVTKQSHSSVYYKPSP